MERRRHAQKNQRSGGSQVGMDNGRLQQEQRKAESEAKLKFTVGNPSNGVEPNREAKRKLSPPKQLSQAQVASSIKSLKPSSFQQAHKSLTKSPEVFNGTDGQPRAEIEVRPTKINHNGSVKGKKAIARTRASQGSSSIAAREESFQFTPQKLEKANKLKVLSIPSCDGVSKQERERMARPKSPNESQLSSMSRSAMGNQHGSGGCGVTGGSGSFNPCKTDLGEGLVQREALDLEGRIRTDNPSVEEGEDSVVADPNQYTFIRGEASHGVGNDEDDRMEFEGEGDVPSPCC